ncbi:Retrovirus-related Pol polyprotein from transposon TNT 1-94 [Dendrobium catenatum]|uniref:Retrovirus-related Pol polyprotein from transposon TNT 1-94 n=1 Tax=Dendrobium catenatum TaxID=906689 RepID=A0A2I0VXK6_9ASPA|nr:Retrovirus-related Pol polyprotein from transposon TNT 1-94 [Dendrobium catenatum]
MTQYLTEIKTLVDQIAAAGSTIDTEDIILYILNGLPPSYQSFKTSIRTMLNPISLDQLYPLLLSEEINLSIEANRNNTNPDPTTALFNSRGRGRRSRGRNTFTNNTSGRSTANTTLVCQICLKRGHSAQDCWHRLNVQYVPSSRTANRALVAHSDNNESNWFLDSGASTHLTNSLDNLSISTPYQGTDNITIGDGSSVNISHTGAGILPTPSRKLHLSNILHSPLIHYNLLSISQLTKDNNVSIIFDPTGFMLKDMTNNKVLLRGPCNAGLYTIPIEHTTMNKALAVHTSSTSSWHHRLGHPHQQIYDLLSSCNPNLKLGKHIFSCNSCAVSKCHKLKFEHNKHRQVSTLDIIHSDVWGPAPAVSHQGYRYYIIFVDDNSRFTWLYPLRHKSEVLNTFINFKTQVEKYTSHQIKVLRTDGGMEYMNNQFSDFLRTHGIVHQTSCPYTPEQNGLAERKHRHIIETTRALLFTASVPYTYWPDAVSTAVYLINRLPPITLNNLSPFETLHKQKPDYGHLNIFGCECFPLMPHHARHKLQPKALPHIFIGYSDTYKGYKCLNRHTNKITISRNVKFHEQIFPFATQDILCNSESSQHSPFTLTPTSVVHSHASPTIPRQNNSHCAPSNLQPQPTRPTQPTQSIPCDAPQPIPVHTSTPHPMVTRSKTGSLKPTQKLNLLHCTSQSDPTTYTEAVKKFEWRQAMATEFLALQRQGTWSLVKPPADASILGCKWTYKTKFHTNGTVAKHKARLVAQGNNQQYGIDYMETFSPVAKLPTIRILLSVALYNNWPIQQLDVANAFLHGKLDETVYMVQPKGFEDTAHPDYVCLLHKALYGLKQAPRQWYNTFTTTLINLGFSHSQSDPSLLIYNKEQVQIYLIIYVDDILITGNDTGTINTILAKLNTTFNMKNLGTANEFLGIKITKQKDLYFLSQEKYAYQILHQANMTSCNPLANPTCTKLPVTFNTEPLLQDPALYRRLTGSLQYLTITRPDIAYSVNQLSQHMQEPLPQHAYLLKRLLRYIKGTLNFGIPITNTNLVLRSYSDADWAGDPISRKSTSGYCSFLGDTIISWTVKKQHTVARSSTESEYRALAALKKR